MTPRMRTQLQLRVEQSKQLHVEVPPGDSPLQRSFALPGKQFILRKECCRRPLICDPAFGSSRDRQLDFEGRWNFVAGKMRADVAKF
jgi:hypothetical protein